VGAGRFGLLLRQSGISLRSLCSYDDGTIEGHWVLYSMTRSQARQHERQRMRRVLAL
jgi:hypothetical protein